MKTTITLLVACATIHTAACSDAKKPSEETAAKEVAKEATGTNADVKEALEGVPLSPAAKEVLEAAPLSLDCAALLSEKDVQDLCGDPTVSLDPPDIIDHEKNTSNMPCARSYSSKEGAKPANKFRWSLLGHQKEKYAAQMQGMNLDGEKEDGTAKLLEGLGAQAFSSVSESSKTYVAFTHKKYNVHVGSRHSNDCIPDLSRLLYKRLDAL